MIPIQEVIKNTDQAYEEDLFALVKRGFLNTHDDDDDDCNIFLRRAV